VTVQHFGLLRSCNRLWGSAYQAAPAAQVVDYYKAKVADIAADKGPDDVATQIRQSL